MDRWIVGDFCTGRLITEVVNAAPGSSWEASLTGGRAELELVPSARLHRVIGELLRAKLGYRYYVAAINERDMVEFAGPVVSCRLDSDSWVFQAVSAWDYLDRRSVVSDQHWTWWAGDNPPIYRWSGTWRQIIAGIWGMVFNRGYLGVQEANWRAAKELQQVWRDFFGYERRSAGRQRWGDPPIIPVGAQSEGGGSHEWSCELLDLDTVGEVLRAINARESGVEIQLQPAWLGDFPQGVMCWQVTTGTDSAPHVIPSGQPWPLDVGAPASRARISEWRADGEKSLTSARVLAGRSGGEGKPFIGWSNRTQEAVPLEDELPEMDVTDTSHTSIVWMSTASGRASSMVLDGVQPTVSCEVEIQAGGALDPDLIRVGDLASLYGGENHAFLPAGVQRMRVLRKTHTGGATRLSLVGLRFPDLQRYKTRWGNQGD